MASIRSGDGQLARWLFIASLFVFVPFFQPRLLSDGALYHEFLRSLVFDADLNFDNEREHYTWRFVPVFPVYGVGEFRDTGYPRHTFNIGPALFWYPFFLIGHGVSATLEAMRGPITADGYSFAERLMTSITSLPLAIAGMLLTMRLVAATFRHGRGDPWPVQRPEGRLAITSVVALASPLPAFVLIAPTFAHALAYAAAAAFLLLATETFGKPRSRETDLIVGFALGLAALARTQFLFLAVMLALEPVRVLRSGDRRSLRGLAPSYARMAAAALVAYSPQLASNLVIFGKAIVDPQGPGGMHWLAPQLRLVLLQPKYGLFTMTPLLAVAALGLPLAIRRDRFIGTSLVLTLLVQAYLNSVRRDWAGVGFGGRRFVEMLPIFTVGFAEIVVLVAGLGRGRRLARLFVGLAAVAIPWNFLSMAQYYLTDLGKPDLGPPLLEIARRNLSSLVPLARGLFGQGLLATSLRELSRGALLDIALFAAALALVYGIIHTIERFWPFLVELVPILVIGLTAAILTIDVFLVYSGFATRHVRAYLVDSSSGQTPEMITRFRHLALRRDAQYEGLRGGFFLDETRAEMVTQNPVYGPHMLDPVPLAIVNTAAREPVLRIKVAEPRVRGIDVVFGYATVEGQTSGPLLDISLIPGQGDPAALTIVAKADGVSAAGSGFALRMQPATLKTTQGYVRIAMAIAVDPPRDARTIEIRAASPQGITVHGLAIEAAR